MSKDILYKAKRVDSGDWVCGLPIYKNYIRVFTEHEYEDEDGRKVKYSITKDYQVDPKTMCEFICLIDKNKNKIFEHDIVDYEDCPASDYYRETIIVNRGVIELKDELKWLTEVDSTALQSSLKDLDNAYKKFFKEHAGYPKFKSKKDNHRSYKSKCVNGNIEYLNNHIKLPKLGLVKTKNKLISQGRIVNATISQELSGKYYVSLCCVYVDIKPFPITGNAVGIDLGIK